MTPGSLRPAGTDASDQLARMGTCGYSEPRNSEFTPTDHVIGRSHHDGK
jgi:hypothetical protein